RRLHARAQRRVVERGQRRPALEVRGPVEEVPRPVHHQEEGRERGRRQHAGAMSRDLLAPDEDQADEEKHAADADQRSVERWQPGRRGTHAQTPWLCQTAQPSASQPARNASPPSGVTAPSQRVPLRLSTYRLSQDSTTPPTNSHPAAVLGAAGQRALAHATANSARAWYIW